MRLCKKLNNKQYTNTIYYTKNKMDLHLFDSITNTLKRFDHDKLTPIKWYTCGPTIYSSAHLGHARTFISFDIIRRVLVYMGYNIIYVMNITDIDDKIINKVNELSKNNDSDIYYKFISDMETEFWSDMDKLGNIIPTVVTRVTEYIDKIKSYIEKMEENGLTYCVDGTVYIDSRKYIENGYDWDIFGRSQNTDYTECDFSKDKKHNADFSLWKAAKPGEIKFESKWGYGRPSWHIECSVMSNDILGNIDIHSGGIDLIYPHHNNELIQTMAHDMCNVLPVKYFLHCGHLNINGEKMAKSLKNFITINDFLGNYGTARQLRLLFLLHSWTSPMDFTDDVLNETKNIESKIVNFISNIKHFIKIGSKVVTQYTSQDSEYLDFIIKSKQNVMGALLNNIDTKLVINIILNIISVTHKYCENDYNIVLIGDVVDYVIKIFDVLGLIFKEETIINESDKFIDIIVDFRKEVRDVIKGNIKSIPQNVVSDMYKIMDDVRDNTLKNNGIFVEDLGLGKKDKWTKHTPKLNIIDMDKLIPGKFVDEDPGIKYNNLNKEQNI